MLSKQVATFTVGSLGFYQYAVFTKQFAGLLKKSLSSRKLKQVLSLAPFTGIIIIVGCEAFSTQRLNVLRNGKIVIPVNEGK